ncbi:MAG TPA: transglutaminase domain-containing protein [Verrucomicrobiae bacterium]|nr:transglutaminase domain-containing protein [Verrucomicrobiae bacterium]
MPVPAALTIVAVAIAAFSAIKTIAADAGGWWSADVDKALAGAGTNRVELLRALESAPIQQRPGMQFLVQHMPAVDRQRLSADFLLENVSLAYEAFEKSHWVSKVPRDIFLNDVLPYASLNERRDRWRKTLRERCLPMITNCSTPGEAAQALNRRLFKATNVRYSTERHRADQGPLETMESGLATCTGLSILLVDACRAVGVPARVAATPMWSNNRGNHTWVEIWDDGWHFTGAAEPDPKGLDRGWFRGDAARAIKDEPRHAIYASSFAGTGLSFPLPWARDVAWVNAENVTDRYATKTNTDTNSLRLQVKVLERTGGPRVAAKVTVTDVGARKLEGTSRGENADLNDILPFELRRGRTYEVCVEREGRRWKRDIFAGTNALELLVVTLSEPEITTAPSQACYLPPPPRKALRRSDEAKLRKEVAEYFSAVRYQQAEWKFSSSLERLLAGDEAAVRAVVWDVFKSAPIHYQLHKDFEANQARFDKHLSPYTVKTVGTRPARGWALFIAMHGGGNAPKRVNDSQWEVMQRYYRDHPEAGGYRYVALRAPNDTWNGFYDTYVYPLVANLIRQFLLFGDVDPNKVFIMGYSHGGYGAYAIGPKMPDRFAAIHASAAAATDGETTARTLRNTIFTAMVGEKDTMYGRYDRNRKFQDAVEQLRAGRPDIYPVKVEIIAGNGHTGLPDRDKIASMYSATRNPVPRELTWLQTDKVIRDFFWLHASGPAKKQELNAVCRDNRVTVSTSTNVPAVAVLLDARLVNFAKPVEFQVNGTTWSRRLQPELRTLCESLVQRGDPELAFSARIDLPLNPPSPPK